MGLGTVFSRIFTPNATQSNSGTHELTGLTVGTERGLHVAPSSHAIEIDPVTTAGTTYYGFAAPGTATSSASWRVLRKVVTAGASSYDWADGDSAYDNVWDNRAGLSYG